jgi:integrase
MTIAVDAYLSYRRDAGFELKIEGQQLLRFARFADDLGHRGALTIELAKKWASSNTTNRLTSARRIEVLRGFAKYCIQFEPATELPAADTFGKAHRRLIPHIYSEREIVDLLDACGGLHPRGGLRGQSCRAIFGLLASTGMRIGEVTALRNTDINLDKKLIEVRNSKFGKSRWVPLHCSTVRHLREYVAKRANLTHQATNDELFFVGDYDRAMSAIAVRYAFDLIRQKLGWKSRGGHQNVRIHDLRHTFICRTVQRWYEEGADVDKNILCLSTYVGHAKITDTYWYLTATPELLALAAARFNNDGEVIT